MSSDPNKRLVRIFDAKTGLERLSEPVAVHAPRTEAPVPAIPELPAATAVTAETPSEAGPLPVQAPPATVAAEPDLTPQPATPLVAIQASEPSAPATLEVSAPVAVSTEEASSGQKNGPPAKPKIDIETLEQFIAYAYGRKGQRATLKSKTERLIAQSPRLDDEAMSRLRTLVDVDVLLAVPRQLLLVSREVTDHPALRAALGAFVSEVMLRHAAFAGTDVQAALRNMPEAPPAADALFAVAAFAPVPVDGKEPLKSADLQALRRNATHLLATWFAINRGLNTEELALLLLQVLWAPASRELVDDNARLRALTEVEHAAGVGLACHRFRQQAMEARASQDQALREASTLRSQADQLATQLRQADTERDAALADLEALREKSSSGLAELGRQHGVALVHLRHSQEQLRGRLVRRLGDSIEMLEVGLTALRTKTPRTEVMAERAEHVIDALRTEEKYLREN